MRSKDHCQSLESLINSALKSLNRLESRRPLGMKEMPFCPSIYQNPSSSCQTMKKNSDANISFVQPLVPLMSKKLESKKDYFSMKCKTEVERWDSIDGSEEQIRKIVIGCEKQKKKKWGIKVGGKKKKGEQRSEKIENLGSFMAQGQDNSQVWRISPWSREGEK